MKSTLKSNRNHIFKQILPEEKKISTCSYGRSISEIQFKQFFKKIVLTNKNNFAKTIFVEPYTEYLNQISVFQINT